MIRSVIHTPIRTDNQTFCVWVIFIEVFDNSGSTFEELQHSVEFFLRHLHTIKHIWWVIITISKLAMPVSQVIVHSLQMSCHVLGIIVLRRIMLRKKRVIVFEDDEDSFAQIKPVKVFNKFFSLPNRVSYCRHVVGELYGT
ncbi:hypothetical protein HMPREF2756_03420 [Rothia sp. HMSC067H10]|nr:hypothetical protein HMPREF2756_03420 [Rothia sp. HMSC067H10]